MYCRVRLGFIVRSMSPGPASGDHALELANPTGQCRKYKHRLLLTLVAYDDISLCATGGVSPVLSERHASSQRVTALSMGALRWPLRRLWVSSVHGETTRDLADGRLDERSNPAP